MHFRAIAEQPVATPRGGMSRLLLGFVVLSLSAHAVLLIIQSPPQTLNTVSLGTTYIHVTLKSSSPSSTTQAEPPADKAATPPEKIPRAIAKSSTATPVTKRPINIQSSAAAIPVARQSTQRIHSATTTTIATREHSHSAIVASADTLTENNRHKYQTAKTSAASAQDSTDINRTVTTRNDSLSSDEQHDRQQAVQREALRNYLLGELRDQLSRYLTYPQRARRRGWEGEVLLELDISTQGRLKNIQMVRSSGYAPLDRSAINSLSRIDKLSLPAATTLQHAISLQLPVVYRLNSN